MKEYSLQDPSSRDRALQSLMQSRLFAPLPAQDLDVILSYAKFLEYAAQEPIFRQTETPDSFFLLLRGDVALLSVDSQQHSVEMVQVGQLEIFGETALLLNQPHAFSAVAKSPAYVLKLRSEVLGLMIEGSPSFARDLSVSLAARFVQASQQIATISRSSAAAAAPSAAVISEDASGIPSKVSRKRYSPAEIRQRLAMIEPLLRGMIHERASTCISQRVKNHVGVSMAIYWRSKKVENSEKPKCMICSNLFCRTTHTRNLLNITARTFLMC